jgi:hypothetical protein
VNTFPLDIKDVAMGASEIDFNQLDCWPNEEGENDDLYNAFNHSLY